MAETREGRPGLPLRSACDTAPIFLHTIDRDGTILASQDGRTGENVFDRAPQEHQAELRAILRRVFESRESGSIEGPNGESGWLSGRYAPSSTGTAPWPPW